MFPEQRNREGQRSDMRPKRRIQPPAWLEDYEVSLPQYNQQSPAVHTLPHREPQEPYIERVAEKTPLIYQPQSDYALRADQRFINHSLHMGPRYESTPVSQPVTQEDVSEILRTVQELRRENQQLQFVMQDMQQKISLNRAPPLQQRAEPLPYDRTQSKASPAPLHDNDEWPLPPPPVVDDGFLPLAVDIPPPLPRHMSNFVDELTSRLRNLKTKDHLLSCPSTPEYCESESFSMALPPQQRTLEYPLSTLKQHLSAVSHSVWTLNSTLITLNKKG